MNKEFIDQPLHVLAGAVLVIAFSFITSLWMAVVISISTGVIREVYQRFDLNRKAFDFGLGSRLDLVFWFIGAFMAFIYLQEIKTF